ncbi:hypothetical protein ODQ44_24575, partial [Escherichia coli]|nr:hypothetical protein [Escherichia coli]
MKFLPYIFLLCCGLWSTISFADEDYIEYRGISSNNRVTLDPLRLSNKELRWLASGFAPIFPDICYHLTHYRPAAADIPVASDNPTHYA